MESSKETGCQTPEGPILCINNCGFFGSAATMNMCSKCHKEMISQQEKLPANSMFAPISKGKEPAAINFPGFQFGSEVTPPPGHSDFSFGANSEVKAKNSFSFEASSEVKASAGPNRCTTCNKRVGLTGFSCRCGNVFCAVHRYSDKHECQFDYRAAAQGAIAKANPVVKAEKLDKI